jgi:hypothetical protein
VNRRADAADDRVPVAFHSGADAAVVIRWKKQQALKVAAVDVVVEMEKTMRRPMGCVYAK